jgi:hypothetical protein
MMQQTVIIAPKETADQPVARRSRRHQEKGRSFKATLLALLRADQFWDGGENAGDITRPVFCQFGGSEQEMASFIANLRKGRKAKLSDGIPLAGYGTSGEFELLRSGKYRYLSQPRTVGDQQHQIVTAYLPELFQFDPGMIPEPGQGIRFILTNPHWWVAEQRHVLEADMAACARILRHAEALHLCSDPAWGGRRTETEILDLAILGARFAGCLDKYTNKPIPRELDFCLQLYLFGLRRQIAGLPKRAVSGNQDDARWNWARTVDALEWNFPAAGLCTPLLVAVDTDAMDQFLAEPVHHYYTVDREAHRAA